MREILTTCMEAVGAVLLTAGIGMVSLPAAFIVGGVLLAGAGWLVAR